MVLLCYYYYNCILYIIIIYIYIYIFFFTDAKGSVHFFLSLTWQSYVNLLDYSTSVPIIIAAMTTDPITILAISLDDRPKKLLCE